MLSNQDELGFLGAANELNPIIFDDLAIDIDQSSQVDPGTVATTVWQFADAGTPPEAESFLLTNTFIEGAIASPSPTAFHAGHAEHDASSDAELTEPVALVADALIGGDAGFQKQLVVSGLQEPMDMAFLPDGQMLFIQKNGIIQIVDPNEPNPTPQVYLDLRSRIAGGQEAGLISIELDPDFETNNYFYIFYSDKLSFGTADDEYRITRFTHGGNAPVANSETVIYVKPDPVAAHHDGGGLSFGPDGKLYLTLGDNQPVERANPGWSVSQTQDLTYTYGKVLRINKDGTIPQDNPFVDGPGGNLDEIWAYGLRNPFRADWDIASNRFFIGDVGGNFQGTAREEINLGQAGANYGWPMVEGFSTNPAYTNPIFDYGHTSTTPNGGAVIAGTVYRGNQFPTEYQGAFFFGDYVLGWLSYLQFDAAGNAIDADTSTPEIDAFTFDDDAGTVVSIKQAPDGSLYYAEIAENFAGPGNIYRITYNTGNQLPVINSASADITEGTSPLTVNFTGSATDADNDELIYTWLFGDGTEATGASVTHTYDLNGLYSATLQVSDGQGTVISSPIDIQAGIRPETIITATLNGTPFDPYAGTTKFRAGDTIVVTSNATDADGVLTEDSHVWDVDFIHNAHVHPENDLIGSSYSIVVPTTGHGFSDTTGYRFEVTVTDADGLTDVEVFELFPDKVDLSISSNVPGDVTYTLDGLPRTGPVLLDTAINFEHSITTPQTVIAGGFEYTFDQWSNGTTTNTYDFIAPDTDQDITAIYEITGEVPTSELPDGLVLHLDADQGVTTSGADLVTVWSDQSSSGNDLFGFGDPRLVTNGLNGHNTIQFDGDGDRLQRLNNTNAIAGLPTGNGDRSVFVVTKYNSGGYGGFAYGNNSNNKTFGLIVEPDGDLAVQAWGGANDNPTNVDGTGAGWLVQSAVLDGGTLSHYKDGVLTEPSATHTYNTTLDKIVLGAEIDGNPHLDMEVAEILVFDRALTEAERLQVDSYLQEAYFNSTPTPNVAPTATDDSANVEEGSSVVIDVLGNDTDSDGTIDPTTVTITSQPTHGTVAVDPVTGAVTYTHTDDGHSHAEPDVFGYTVNDNDGATSNVAVVSVTAVEPTPNVAPIATDDSANVVNGGAVVIDVLANDSDSDGTLDATTVAIVDNPALMVRW
jgi:glucose/arabinose dehydrogenase